jgi:hypothetical protein
MKKKYIQLNTIELSLSTDTWKIEIQTIVCVKKTKQIQMYTTYHYKHYSNIDKSIVTYAVHSENNLDMVR